MISILNTYSVKDKSKIDILDSLRAFAAISVLLFHFVCTTTGYIKTQWVLDIFSVGCYGVQLFFVISGFIIPWAMFHAGYELKDFGLFLLKRLARLEPPYIFSILLALTVLFLREHFLGKSNDHITISVKQVALHLGYLIPFFEGYKWLNPVYWTLAIEFQYYLLIALLFTPLIKSSQWMRYGIYALIIALSIISHEKFIFFWMPVFFLGTLLFLYLTSVIRKTEYYISTAAFITFCFFKFPLASVIYSVLPLVCILFFRYRKIPFLNYIGNFSYSLYLVHPILGASLINILSHKFTNPYAKFTVILGGIVFTLLSAWITYILIEKPSKKLSSSIKYKKTVINN
ncbi:MAG: acyltransferase family protein [Bacteroidia bacterium]